MIHIKYETHRSKIFKSDLGKEPVKDWLKELSKDEKKIIGSDVKMVEYGWPIGMPVCKPLGSGLYEVRSGLPSHRISRIIFCIHKNEMILLHGFIKKSQKTPKTDMDLAITRKRILKNEK